MKLEQVYHLGLERSAALLNMTVSEVLKIASPRIREYWLIMERTKAFDNLIPGFEKLCDDHHILPVNAIKRLKKHYGTGK
jgi:ABC-type arginine transport system permease subunit